jgi:hypothetical protein
MIGKLMNETRRGGYGWFQNPITLDDRYIANSTFNEDVVEEARKSIADPDSITVLLTGRTTEYAYQIKSILDSNELYFDHYGFKPIVRGQKITTMQFKQDFIRELVEQYGVDAIEFWEDREKHVKKFTDFIDVLGLKGEVHFVQESPCYMDEHLEREVVDILKRESTTARFENSDKKPIYYGAFLYPESHYELLNHFRSSIPEDWKTFAHHMTLLFGKNKNPEVEEFIKNNMGKDVILQVGRLGISDDAIAVDIYSDVPSDNKIPHITLAVPPGGKPVNSNKITEWEPVNEPISLKANISAFYG